MREIKFRAWNTQMKHMVFPTLDFGREIWPCTYKRIIKSETNENGDTVELVLEMVSIDHILQDPIFEVMQFTGLTDKTGREIYERDIVQHDAWDYPFEVIFDNSKARFVSKLKTGLTQFIDNDRLIIIGNIYENPELLK